MEAKLSSPVIFGHKVCHIQQNKPAQGVRGMNDGRTQDTAAFVTAL